MAGAHLWAGGRLRISAQQVPRGDTKERELTMHLGEGCWVEAGLPSGHSHGGGLPLPYILGR